MSRYDKQLKLPIGIKSILLLTCTLLVINIIMTGNVLAAENGSSSELSKPASVSLHGEKTDVSLEENILIKLSAVNLITNPVMHVQVIIIPPSGMSVTSSEFSKSDAGQFTTNYNLPPGDGKDIEIKIRANQAGNFNVSGRIIYYFGNDTSKAKDYVLTLPIKVRDRSSISNKISTKEDNRSSISNKISAKEDNRYDEKRYSGYISIIFTVVMFTIIIVLAYLLFRKMKNV